MDIDCSRFAFIPIAGLAGSGKSDAIARLKDVGEQVLNIEEIAGLQGVCLADLFGETVIGQREFQERLHARFHSFSNLRHVYVEWKKPEVTGFQLPAGLVAEIRLAPAVYIEEPRPGRVLALLQKYSEWNEHLDLLMTKLPWRGVGSRLMDELSAAATQSTQAFVERLLSEYLDPLYEEEVQRLNIVWRGSAGDLNENYEAVFEQVHRSRDRWRSYVPSQSHQRSGSR